MDFVQMRGITKIFGKVVANDRVDFSVKKGEIHSLLGENGAGKTTLMRMLYGMSVPDEGSIILNGSPVTLKSPSSAIEQGISMVHQHFMLADPMTVTENIVLGYEPRKGPFFDRKKAEQQVAELSARYGLQIDPKATVGDLSVGNKQRVEILKALYRKCDLLILDEPTAVLTPLEVKDLFAVLRSLKEDGKTIIIITHKLKEILEISDRVTILRAGKLITTKNTAETDAVELARLMVGRQVQFEVQGAKPVAADAPVLLEVKDAELRRRGMQLLSGLSLQVHAGEIFGICGVEGNGQTELIEAITGIGQLSAGQVLLNGQPVHKPTPTKMADRGLAHIPEDRGLRGLVADFSIRDNSILGYQRSRRFSRRGVLDKKAIEMHTRQIVSDYRVKVGSIDDTAASLSGGNQQKVVIGRALSQDPDVIIAAQPTRGVDIGAIEYIHQKLIEMKNAGKAILLISAELDEVLGLSDQVGVLYRGRIVATGAPADFDEQTLGLLMTGYHKDTEKEERPCLETLHSAFAKS